MPLAESVVSRPARSRRLLSFSDDHGRTHEVLPVPIPPLHYEWIIRNHPDLVRDACLWKATTVPEVRRALVQAQENRLNALGPVYAVGLHAYANFRHGGGQVYLLDPTQAGLFAGTGLSKVSRASLCHEKPSRGCYVALADCPWLIWGGDKTHWHRIAGFYVTWVTPTILSLYLWALPNELAQTPTEDAVAAFVVRLDEDPELERVFELEAVRLADALMTEPNKTLRIQDPATVAKFIQSCRLVWRCAVNLLVAYETMEVVPVYRSEAHTEPVLGMASPCVPVV